MRVLITGAAGMIGRKLVARLLRNGTLRDRKISQLDLHDIVAPEATGGADIVINSHTGDLSASGAVAALVAAKPDVIFHLAGVVSGEAEANFDLGYRVNTPKLSMLGFQLNLGPDVSALIIINVSWQVRH